MESWNNGMIPPMVGTTGQPVQAGGMMEIRIFGVLLEEVLILFTITDTGEYCVPKGTLFFLFLFFYKYCIPKGTENTFNKNLRAIKYH